jgi:hypothetical protein
VRGYLINKNLCFYYWLKKRVGKKCAFRVAITAEKVVLIFGREPIQDKGLWAYLKEGDRVLKK